MNYTTLSIYKTKLIKAYECSLFDPAAHPSRLELKETLFLTREFDGEGRIVNLTSYFNDARPLKERKLKYDGQGRIEEEERIYHETGSTEILIHAYEPDEEIMQVLIGDEPVEETIARFHPNGKKKETEKLDAEGNVLEFTEWDEEENLIHRLDAKEEVFIEYIDGGRQKKVRRVTGDGEELEIHTMEGKKPLRVEYWKDGKELGRDEYEYPGDFVTEKRTYEGDELVSRVHKKENEASHILEYEEENYRDTASNRYHIQKQTQNYEYTPAGNIKRSRITATHFPHVSGRLRVSSPVTSDGIMEATYDAEDRQTELLLSAYPEDNFDPDSYYRFEYT
jgi:hypothetical protein